MFVYETGLWELLANPICWRILILQGRMLMLGSLSGSGIGWDGDISFDNVRGHVKGTVHLRDRTSLAMVIHRPINQHLLESYHTRLPSRRRETTQLPKTSGLSELLACLPCIPEDQQRYARVRISRTSNGETATNKSSATRQFLLLIRCHSF